MRLSDSDSLFFGIFAGIILNGVIWLVMPLCVAQQNYPAAGVNVLT
jgi:hypothetical protein